MPAAPVLALRFLCGLGMLAVGPLVCWDLLVRSDVVAAASDAGRQELGMVGLVLSALAVAVFAWFQPVAVSWRPARVPAVLAVYLPFLFLWLAFVVAYLAVVRQFGEAVQPQSFLGYLAAADPARPGFWVVVVGITVAAPVAEEIVFRGYLQGALAGLLPRWAAIAAVAALFGLVHTLPYALPLALLGGLFGWLVDRHGSLLPAVVAHSLHNGLTVAVTVIWPQSLDLLYSR